MGLEVVGPLVHLQISLKGLYADSSQVYGGLCQSPMFGGCYS
jgi:hypothetical protein